MTVLCLPCPTPPEVTLARASTHLQVLITAIPADPCQFPTADFINKLSVVNKQDYARLHNFELHISSEIDPNVAAVRVTTLWRG
jgi:hypothetical protein